MTSRISDAFPSARTGIDFVALARQAINCANYDHEHKEENGCSLSLGPARVYWITTYEIRRWELAEDDAK